MPRRAAERARARVDAKGRAWVVATLWPISTPSAGLARSTEVELLVDTGADRTCVASSCLAAIGSVPHDVAAARDFLGRVASVDLHHVWLQLIIRGTPHRTFLSVAALPHASGTPSIDGLLGLDVLRALALAYDGPGRQVAVTRARRRSRRRR